MAKAHSKRVVIVATAVLWLAGSIALAQDHAPATHDPARCAPNGIAVGGYDVVSYQQSDGPLQGDDGFVAEHDRLQYLFANAENRDAFLADPERYLPHYGGWCATALSFGGLICPDYRNFKIENGMLLLFETTGFTNGQTVWNSDPKAFRKKADDNYLGLIGAQ